MLSVRLEGTRDSSRRLAAAALAAAALIAPSRAAAAGAPDTLHVRLSEERLAAKGGLAPVLSPDGKRLLFARKPNSDWHDEWWLASAAGTGARLLFRSAKAPAWSPDGKRIAFNRYLGKVVIYDLAQGREFEVFQRPGVDVNGPWWTPDGKSLVFREAATADPAKNVPYLLDLDDLSAREIRTDWRNSEGYPGEVDWPGIFDPGASQGPRLACAPQTEPFSQRVAYSDGSLPALGDRYGGAFQGLWAVSEDGRYAVRLSPKSCLSFSANPASGHVAFAAPDGIRVAALAARPAPWNSNFALPIGAVQGAGIGRHLIVYSKKVNPLNGKVVGYREDDVKGALEIVSVREGEALAELVEWTGKPLKPDDVAAGEYRRVDNTFAQGGRVTDRWSTIGAPLAAAALEGWVGGASAEDSGGPAAVTPASLK